MSGVVVLTIEAVFFDFVGTITTKEGETAAHQNLIRELLRRTRRTDLDPLMVWKEYEEENARMFKELAGKRYVPIREIDRMAMERVGERHGFKVDEGFWKLNLHVHSKYAKAFPDALETVTTLKEMGLHVGLITDSDNDYIETHLRAIGMYGLFNSVTTSEDAGFYKPHPRIFKVALEGAKVPPKEAIYVGDNPEKDCVGAENVGMLSVLLDPDASKREAWSKCRVIISNLRDVIKLVHGLNGSR